MKRVALWTLLVLVMLAACAPRSAQVIPTVMVLPSPTDTAVPTVALPTPPPRATATFLPTATFIQSTRVPTAQPTAPVTFVESLTVLNNPVVVASHDLCAPTTTRIAAVVLSSVPVQSVLLNWTYTGRFSSRPGQPMTEVVETEYVLDLGPFEKPGSIIFWVAVRDINGRETISDEVSFQVQDCTQATATETPYGPTPTQTPPYGAEFSVKANELTIQVPYNTPVQITLSWQGGFVPFTVDQISRPQHGTLAGTAPVMIYTPNLDYTGSDFFTFRVTDVNRQASRGTVSIIVQPPQ